MSIVSDLPSNWRPRPELRDLIPSTHDWRSFAPIPFAPRYAACINGHGVYDLKRREFLSPITDKRNGRVRYRLATAEPEAGKRDAVKKPYYASIILTLTEGERRNRKTQAHHQDHDCTNDTWRNLSWVTARANRRMAAEHSRGSRAGSANPNANAKMGGNNLAGFIAFYDRETRERGRCDLKPLAEFLDMTTDQLRRIATGRSRSAEVAAIREAQAREEQERRDRQRAELAEENPFLA